MCDILAIRLPKKQRWREVINGDEEDVGLSGSQGENSETNAKEAVRRVISGAEPAAWTAPHARAS
jgi:hypothetical protein